MTNKAKKSKKNNQQVWVFTAIILLLLALSAALIVGLIKQADTISKYDLLSRLDNQACRYLEDRGSDSQVSGGFMLNTDENKNDAKLTYYCHTGENVNGRTIQGKPIGGYRLGATVSYFSSNKAAEAYANNKLNPLRYWSDDGTASIQDKNYKFIVTDEAEPYFDAYRVRANAVVRVSLPCESPNPEACDNQAAQLLNQELKGINTL